MLPLPTGLTALTVQRNLMAPRPDWNRLGPRLPRWFRRRLKEVDPQLEMQFMPPRSSTRPREGVDSMQFPEGVWVICYRMRHTRWLYRRWVYRLATPEGRPDMPRRDLVQLLKWATNLRRNGRERHLLDLYERGSMQVHTEKVAASKERELIALENTMRERNICDRLRPQMLVGHVSEQGRRPPAQGAAA